MNSPTALPGPPHSQEAEISVLAQMMARPKIISEVAGEVLFPEHFYRDRNRKLFELIVEHYVAGDSIDPLTIGEAAAARDIGLGDQHEAIEKLQRLTAHGQTVQGAIAAHAAIVRRKADQRSLLSLTYEAQAKILNEHADPDDVAALLTEGGMKVVTEGLHHHETISYGDLGRHFVRRMHGLMAARAQGYELGVYFGIRAIDDYTRGLKPTELMIIAGPPGSGKSAVSWTAGKKFAERQESQQERKERAERLRWQQELSEDDRRAWLQEHMPDAPEEEKAIIWQDGPRVPDERIGTLVLSLEMGQEPSEDRLAQEVAGVDGGKLREGSLTTEELQAIVKAWRPHKNLRMYFNFTSHFRASQMRAYISDEIRTHKIGLVIIDHFRYFDLDRRPDDRNKEDEEKARFLKTHIAEDLNVAVICLAHTTKEIDTRDKRPTLKHLAGSGQIAAHADFVGFVHRPIKYASKKAIESGDVKATDAELIWEKNRHNLEERAPIYLDLSKMHLADADGHEGNQQIPF